MKLSNLLSSQQVSASAEQLSAALKTTGGRRSQPTSERARPPLVRPSSDTFTAREGLDAGGLLKLRLGLLLDRGLEGPTRGAGFAGVSGLGVSGSADSGVVVEARFHIPNPIDVIKGVLDAGGDLLHAGVDAVREALERGGRFLLGAAEVVIDAANKTIDFVGDAANDLKAAADVLRFAAEHGLRLVGRAREAVHHAMLDAINRSLGVGDKIEALGVGDSYTLSGGADAGWGVDGSVEGAVEVTRTGGDSYVVSAEVSADVGVELFEGAAVGAGGRVEFTFDNPEDARRAALVLAAGGAGVGAAVSAATGNPAAYALLPALQPTGDELKFLRSHLSAAEVTGSVSAQLDAEFEAGAAGRGAAFEAEASHSYRMEFENGKPVAIVRTTELSVSADVASNLILSQLGRQTGNSLEAAIGKGGELTGTLTVETRLPLDGARITDVSDFLTNPNPAAFAGSAETNIKASVVVDQGGSGIEAEVELSGLSIADAQRVVGGLLHGGVGEVLRNLPFGVSGSVSSFEDTGHNPHLDLKVQGFGIEIEGRSEERDRTVLGSIDTCEPRPGSRNAGRWRGAF